MLHAAGSPARALITHEPDKETVMARGRKKKRTIKSKKVKARI